MLSPVVFLVREILTPLLLLPVGEKKDPTQRKTQTTVQTQTTTTPSCLRTLNPESQEEAVAATTDKKTKAAPVYTPPVPFLPAQVSTFQQVSYSRDGGSWIEVSVFTSGFVNTGEFKFELARDGTNLAFSQVIPVTFFENHLPTTNYWARMSTRTSRMTVGLSTTQPSPTTFAPPSSTSHLRISPQPKSSH